MSSHMVCEGDALRLIKEEVTATFDAVLTDPPWGFDYQSGHRPKSERFEKIQNDTQPFIWWLWDAYRVLNPGGHLICFCGITLRNMDPTQTPGNLAPQSYKPLP